MDADIITLQADSRGKVLPLYLVIENSDAAAEHLRAPEADLSSLLQEDVLDPVAMMKTRLTLLGFAEQVVCYLDLVDLRRVQRMPGLVSRGSVKFGPLFRDLRSRIDKDVDRLIRRGHTIYTPMVVVVAVSDPTEPDWREALSELRDPDWWWHPHISVLGLGKLSPEMAVAIATRWEWALVADFGSTLQISSLVARLGEYVRESEDDLSV